MLVPETDETSYLKDAARAQKVYWKDQKETYWPDLGPSAPTNWLKILWVTLWVLAALGLFWLYCNHQAHQPIPVVNTPHHTIESFHQFEAHPPPPVPVICTTTVDPTTGFHSYKPSVCP